MSYYFKNADNNFSSFSTVYNVYNDENLQVTSIVVGYCMYNHIFFYTEYKGGNNYSIVDSQEDFNNILYEFSQIFEYMDYLDIFSNEFKYDEYKDKVPPITKDKLYIYDSFGEVAYKTNEWIIVPDDNYVEYLVDNNIAEGSWLLLEDYDDEDNLYVNLNEYDRDDISGFFLYIKDWEALKQETVKGVI